MENNKKPLVEPELTTERPTVKVGNKKIPGLIEKHTETFPPTIEGMKTALLGMSEESEKELAYRALNHEKSKAIALAKQDGMTVESTLSRVKVKTVRDGVKVSGSGHFGSFADPASLTGMAYKLEIHDLQKRQVLKKIEKQTDNKQLLNHVYDLISLMSTEGNQKVLAALKQNELAIMRDREANKARTKGNNKIKEKAKKEAMRLHKSYQKAMGKSHQQKCENVAKECRVSLSKVKNYIDRDGNLKPTK